MLLLMRHGQVSFGAADYDKLSPLGQAQAQATGAFLHAGAVGLGLACVGSRVRRRETADGVLTASGGAACPRRPDEALDELFDGHQLHARGLVAEGGTPMPAGAAVPSRVRQLIALIGVWADGRAVLCSEAARADSERVRLAVTSAGVIAATVCEVLQLPHAMFLPLVRQVANASLTELTVNDVRLALRSFNGTAHLPVEQITWI